MLQKNAIGFSPKQSVLGGLKRQGSAGAAAYGQAMAGAAGLEMDKEAQNQQFGINQMKQDTGLQMQADRQKAENQTNRMREQTMGESLDSRKRVFDTGMNFQYAAMRKQDRMRRRQAALDIFARML